MLRVTMSLQAPPPISGNPIQYLLRDLRNERRSPVPYPPGDTKFSVGRAGAMLRDPLTLLLDAYSRYGPVFTLRLLTSNVIVLLGPEANHHVLVSNAANFSWREGSMGNLIPLLGDGLLTIDGEFHRRSRKIMLPAFHHEQIGATLETMDAEIEAAMARWRVGDKLDLYVWTRELALRIAMRSLFGLDPDGQAARSIDAARLFNEALSFYSYDMPVQWLRGPRTPWRRMQEARSRLDQLIYGEINSRRRTGERGLDLLSLLLDASDEDGTKLRDRHIRDEVMTLLFAGHDTTTSTIAFMVYELTRAPSVVDRLTAEEDELLAGGTPTAEQLMKGELSELEQVLDETLRMYPPAWVGPRRSIQPFTVHGIDCPGNAPVFYSSWVSHRLPDVWEAPDEFRPERFAPEAKKELRKGAYVPFGAGPRTCIGMRFGQLEIRAIATAMLSRFSYELAPGYTLHVRQQPTIGPADGLPLVIGERRPARAGSATAAV
jgi:cytochrome P450